MCLCALFYVVIVITAVDVNVCVCVVDKVIAMHCVMYVNSVAGCC